MVKKKILATLYYFQSKVCNILIKKICKIHRSNSIDGKVRCLRRAFIKRCNGRKDDFSSINSNIAKVHVPKKTL